MSGEIADKHGDPKLLGTIETSKSIFEISVVDNHLSELNKRMHEEAGGGEDGEDDPDREERHRKKKKKSKDREKSDKEKKHKDKDKDRDEKKRSKHDRHSSRSKDRSTTAEPASALVKEGRRDSPDRRDRDRSRSRDDRRRGRSPDSRERYSSSSRYHRDNYDYDYDSRSRSRGRRERERGRDRRADSRDRSSRDRGDRRRNSRDRDNYSSSRRSTDRNAPAISSSSNKDRYTKDSSSKKKTDEKKQPEEEVNIHGYKQVTLKEVMSANPGISMPEAVVRLNMYNSAVVRNEIPPSLSTSAIPHVNPLGIMDSNALTKPHREIYVGNLPPAITVPQLAEFLNAALKQLGISPDGNSVVTAWVSPDGHYGFVELKTVEEATAALAHLNGVQVGVHALRVGRPKGYIPGATIGGSALAVPMQPSSSAMSSLSLSLGSNPIAMATTASMPGLSSSNPLMASLNLAGGGMIGAGGVGGEALSNVLMVSNLPAMITEEQIKELFTPFGPLRAFNLIKTTIGSSAGTQAAVFEYEQAELAESVVGGMSGLDVGGLKLLVVRIPVSSAAVLLRPKPAPAAEAAAAVTKTAAVAAVSIGPPKDPLELLPPTTVIRLSNMTTEADLTDDQAYSEVVEDVAEECNAHATVLTVVIPREKDDKARGMVFVHCTDSTGAGKARQKVHGRKFNGKIVQAVFYPEELFVKGIYSLPADYDRSKAGSVGKAIVTAADELD